MNTRMERNAPNDYNQPVVNPYASNETNINALNVSAIAWNAVIAGAVASAALSLILMILGTGLGLSSVSPWVNEGVSAKTFGISSILWITLTSIVAAGFGGYLAGRLRTRWLSVDTDEVHFRDTAHGFLSWAVATLITVTLLTSAITSIVKGGLQTGAAAIGGIANTAAVGAMAAGSEMAKSPDDNESMNYFLDALFRTDMSATPMADSMTTEPSARNTAPPQNAAEANMEVTRIFANGLAMQSLPPEDLRYVGQVVAQRTGLSQQEAEKRVNDTYVTIQSKMQQAEQVAKTAADQARKASSYAALWLFISLLIGAFTASLMATYGGRQRDL